MSRRRLDVLSTDFSPVQVVWELTLRCDSACAHCGSRAGRARRDELSTEEALGVVLQLAGMRAVEVSLIGGEAYLHEGFLEVAASLRRAGVEVAVITGGRGVTPELARAMVRAGVNRLSASIDGLEAAHDRLRGKAGSFERATRALGHAREAGMVIVANTNVNRLNRGDLEGLYEHLRSQGISGWQVQLTTPFGRAADHPDLVLQPWDLLDLMPRLAALKRRAFDDGVGVMPGDNVGYFGPEEALLRSPGRDGTDHWAGCQAGRFVMGIESDGTVKGCASLSSEAYAAGNLRERPLAAIWTNATGLAFARRRSTADLWGFCATCPFGEVCLGGCTFAAHAVYGRRGNNPFCHFRARTLAKQGKRERLVPAGPASAAPFEVVLERQTEEMR